jgi:hypothetical protein
MADTPQPNTAPTKGRFYDAPDGSTYQGDGENWVLQDPGQIVDAAKGGKAGLIQGGWKALTFPGNLGEMALGGAQLFTDKDSAVHGDIQRLRDEYTYPSSYEGSRHLLEKTFPTSTYEPQHMLGNVAKTAGDILPSAALGVLGEGALGAAYGPAAVRAGLSTAGGALGGGLTHDNMPLLEGPAEALGMAAGMGGPAIARGILKPKKGGVVEATKKLGGALAEQGIPGLVGGAAGAYLAPRFGQNPFLGGSEGLIAGLIGGGPIMKAGGQLANAVGKAVVPKAIPQTASAMVKALSKKTPYNTKGLDTATAAALLAGQGAPAAESAIGPP